jgi:peptidoglycan/xylan/chitin deacetylase (PgdA/CDA1 family)
MALVAVASAIVGPRPPRSSAAARTAEPVPILMYHVIAPSPPGAAFPELFVRPADFAAQMRWLAGRGYHAMTLLDVYDHWLARSPLPHLPIVVSFDDGYLGDYTEALPVLRRLHWPGVLNLEVNNVRPSDLSFWRVQALKAAGWEIDAHTITHPDLTTLDDNRLWREVSGSRAELRRMFHVPVDFFCYPHGRYDARVIDAVRRAGYFGATTENPGLAQPADLYTLSRIRVDRGESIAAFGRQMEALTRSPY